MLRRILALILKELSSLWKDPKSRMVLVVPPLIQVIIFAHAATFDVSGAALAIWNDDRGSLAGELIRRFAYSSAFKIVAAPQSQAEAAALIDGQQAVAVLHIPERFSADLLAGRGGRLQLLIDARRSNTALLVQGYANAIVATYAAEHAPRPPPLVIETRDWFNPTLEPEWFVLPGLVAVLSMLIGMMVAALSLARERELGTFEQMLVTPLRPAEIMIGTAIPAMIVGLFEANIVIAAAVLWFRVPFVGSLALLEAGLLVYLLAGVGVGLAISSVAQTQQQAILGVFIYASPAVMLSGFASPIENMPPIVQWITLVDPMRWMLIIARGVFLQGMPAAIAWSAIWPMALIGIALMTAAGLMVRRAVA